MQMRQPDALDYGLIAAVTVLAYLQLPWRPEIRATLRRWVSFADSVGSALAGVHAGYYAVGIALLGALAVVLLLEILPRVLEH